MQNTLKKRVMRRVYAIWFIRKAAPAAGELAGFALLTNWGLNYISPVHVVANAFSAANGVQTFVMYFVRTFLEKPAAVEFALIATATLGIIVMRDVWLQVNRLAALRQKLVLSS